MHRRKFLLQAMAAGVGVSALPFVSANAHSLSGGGESYSARAIDLVREATVIDMLGEFYSEVGERNGVPLTELWLTEPGSFSESDFRKYKESGVNVFGYGAGSESYEQMVEHLTQWNGLIDSNSNYIERIDSVEKLNSINASGKLGIMMTYQDAEHFRKPDDVDFFYKLGQRVSQLTNNGKNKLGSGFFLDSDTGLTGFGASIVERMNKVGMGVDVSHSGDQTILDALSVSKKPVLITHAPCRALNPGNARAVTDEAIKKMAAGGGVIGIPILRFMIRDREPVTPEHFLDHIDHVAQLVGVEHVGIGSDQPLDTQDAMPVEIRKDEIENAPPKYKVHSNSDYLFNIEGLNHSRRIYDITDGLIRRGYSDTHIKLILGGNFKRALTDIFTT